jgi:pimeloyl-ACP methyl ester carboxylesterase
MVVLLIHGGLWEDMDAERFWVRPGIVAGLRTAGHEILAPDRLRHPPDWQSEVAPLAALLPAEPVTVVAGSNGCSVAARLALAAAGRVARLVLAWPATAHDAVIDAATSADMRHLGASEATIDTLLAGGALRGVADEELAALDLPVGVLPAAPSNPFHQRVTVERLMTLMPGAVELPGCPESPRPEFPAHRAGFVATVAGFAQG